MKDDAQEKNLLESLTQDSPKTWPAPWGRGRDLPTTIRSDVDAAVLAAIRSAQAVPAPANRRIWVAAAAILPIAVGLFIFFQRKTEPGLDINVANSLGTQITPGGISSERLFELKQGDAVQLEIPATGKAVVAIGPANFQITKEADEVQIHLQNGRITLLSQIKSSHSGLAFIVGSVRLLPVGTSGLIDVNAGNIALTVTEGAFEARFNDGRPTELVSSGKTWTYANNRSELAKASAADKAKVNEMQVIWRSGGPLSPSIVAPALPSPQDALDLIRKTYGSIQRVEQKDGSIIFGYVEGISRETMTIVTPDGRVSIARSNVVSMKDY
ncbi:MAG: hypothetical protein K8S54_21065 [Spirochaetia bacterium]|nr:hypothetical protein [Spirochaetia bacterium]